MNHRIAGTKPCPCADIDQTIASCPRLNRITLRLTRRPNPIKLAEEQNQPRSTKARPSTEVAQILPFWSGTSNCSGPPSPSKCLRFSILSPPSNEHDVMK